MFTSQDHYDMLPVGAKKAADELLYAHDGPVTRFVVLTRAIDLAQKMGGYRYADDIPEALDYILEHVDLEPEGDYSSYNTAD